MLINWAELQHMRYVPPGRGPGGSVNWDNQAKMYAKMAAMEAEYTEYQVNAFPCGPQDTVLDIGCGPGRITVPMARRSASVTALDSSEGMLAQCRSNCEAAGVTNVQTLALDWHDTVAGGNVAVHDVVVCSRTAALGTIERLSAFARKRVAVILWANAPSIPPILDRLFAGAQDEQLGGGPGPDRTGPARFLGYNVLFNLVYDLGYEPNVAVVPDGFTRTFTSAEEQYEYLRDLRRISSGQQAEATFRSNVDHFTSVNDDGTRTFRMETRSVVIWWDVARPSFEDIWG